MTAQVVARFDDPRMTYYKKNHEGRSAARNFGLRQARGEFITFCDDDDILLPQKLSHQHAFMKNCGFSISFTNVYVEEGGKRTCWLQRIPKNLPRYLLTRNPFPIHAAMIKKECFENIGGFDENLPACEEYDWWLRALPRYEFHILNEPLAVYIRHRQNTVRDKQLMSRYMNAVALQHIDEVIAAFPKKISLRAERRARRHYLLREVKRQVREYHLGQGIHTLLRSFNIAAKRRNL